jgi:FkbM family methyltransferase
MRNFHSLRHRVDRAGLSDIISCVQAVAADRPGELMLALNPGHPGDHHLADEGEPVTAVTLDDLVATDPRPVSLIKIDVQGAESMVLAGTRGVIETYRPALFIEIHEPSLTRLGSSRRELIHAVVELGYDGHSLTRRGIGPREEPKRLFERSSTGYIDVLFLPVGVSSAADDRHVGKHCQ